MDTTLPLMRLGSELRRRRRERGLTQAQLAQRAHVSRAIVIRAERGDPTIAIGSVDRLLRATGAELHAQTTRMPTLDEARALFADDE